MAGEKLSTESYVLNNYMEMCVAELAPRVLTTAGVCSCETCMLDVMAIALNNLPPKYVVTKRGELYTKLSILQHQFDVDIVAELSKAAEVVGRNPRHC